MMWCSIIRIRGWRGGGRIGLDHAQAWCGEWCGVPIPYCGQCAISDYYAYQISANTKQMRALARNNGWA